MNETDETADDLPVEVQLVQPREPGAEQPNDENVVAVAPPTKAVALPSPEETGRYQLPNAMAGRQYRAVIDLRALKIQEAAKLYETFNEQLAAVGLAAQPEEDAKELLGIGGTVLANTQGEHIFLLDYTYDKQRVFRKKIALLVNPDPRSLWRNLEPDAAAPYPKAHLASTRLFSADYQILAASRRGRSHAHEGTFRDDDFAVSVEDDGWHILIVADGAGSAKFSRQGSRLACRTAQQKLRAGIRELLQPKLPELLTAWQAEEEPQAVREIKTLLYQTLGGAAFAAYKSIEEEAAQQATPVKDYATTLLLSIARKSETGTFVAAFGIGDGGIGAYDATTGEITLMNQPDGGEFSGQTRFLTMREVIGDGQDMLQRVKFALFPQLTTLVLMTDGISDAKFGTDKNLLAAAQWGEFWQDLTTSVNLRRDNAEAETQLLEWMDFWLAGEHDDRTLALLVQTDG